MDYFLKEANFKTPCYNTARMFYRENTNDWNTITASMVEDEYHLKALSPLSGVAIDVGAYVGSVSIALAIDNPGLRIVCVEPVSANIALILKSVEANNLSDRITIIEGAAGGPKDKHAKIKWAYAGESHLEHHAFVGNASLLTEYGNTPGLTYRESTVECYSLSRLLDIAQQDRISLLKIDCEGDEWRVLTDPAIDRINTITGEWHPSSGRTGSDFKALLDKTHTCFFTGPQAGPQEFTAMRRASLYPLAKGARE